jgi:predicted DNA-binding transcriptional regulator YafY
MRQKRSQGSDMRHERLEQGLMLARRLAASAEGMTIDEIAAELGGSRRTAERIRNALERVFPQMEELKDGAYKRFRITRGLDSFFQNPTIDELNALNQCAAEMAGKGLTHHARALRELEAKVRAAMKAPVRVRTATDLEALMQAELIAVQAGPRPVENDDLLITLREAFCAMKVVRFMYRSVDKPARTREVEPYGIIFGRMNYLIGPERGGDRIKNWRLDRIEDIAILDLSAPRPDDFSLSDFANASFGFFQGEQEDVVLRILKPGLDDFEHWRFHPTQTVEDEPEGTKIVRFRASGMLELAWHLFTWQTKIQIIAPDSLRAQMQQELMTAVTHHQTQPPPPRSGKSAKS